MTSISTVATTTTKLVLNAPKYYNKFRYIHKTLNQFTRPYIFIVACVGFITNSATVVLLSRSFVTQNTKHKWTLIALALSDLVHNSALLIRVIHDIGRGRLQQLCIVISFLSQFAELLSACFTVLFTIQRYAAVRYPLKAVVHKRSAPIVIILLIILFNLIFCIALTHASAYVDCHEELKLIWFIADALLSFIIPFSLILIYNICIIDLIRKHARSSISKQSILLRPHKLVKNHTKQTNKKPSGDVENHSVTCSHGTSVTLHGLLIETDADNKYNTNDSPTKKDNKTKSKVISNILNEYQASEISIPTASFEIVSADPLSDNQPPTSPHHSNKSHSGRKKSKGSAPSTTRRASCLSNEIDYVLKKDSQTSQSIRVTRMLILVSTCFLILNAPAHLCVIAFKIYTEIDSHIYSEHSELDSFKQTRNLTNNQLKNFVFIPTNNNTITKNQYISPHDLETVDDQILVHLFYIAVSLTQLISYASYSINFFLYSYSGITFRTGLRVFFNKLRNR